jgi:hypothetical protein
LHIFSLCLSVNFTVWDFQTICGSLFQHITPLLAQYMLL